MTASKKSFLAIFLALFFVFGGAVNCLAENYQPSTPLQKGLQQTATVSGYVSAEGDNSVVNNKSPEDVIAAGIKVALQILPIVYLILLLYAGFVWMLSSGDPKKVSDAKSMLIHSSIGFVLIYVAAALVYEILNLIIFDASL